MHGYFDSVAGALLLIKVAGSELAGAGTPGSFPRDIEFVRDRSLWSRGGRGLPS